MTVCIVGNSDNVVGSNKGSLVDECNVVIRINDFLVEGHEKDVGSKTSVVACAFSGANKIVNDPSWPTKSLLRETQVWMVRIPRPDRIKRGIDSGVNMNSVMFPTQKIYDKLVIDVYSKFWRKEPSSGLVTIAMALSEYSGQQIFIHGFDNKTGKEGKRHYFDPDYFDVDRPNDPVGHDWESESFYIQSLIDNGSICRL